MANSMYVDGFRPFERVLKADPQLFDECSAKHRADEEEEVRREQEMRERPSSATLGRKGRGNGKFCKRCTTQKPRRQGVLSCGEWRQAGKA